MAQNLRTARIQHEVKLYEGDDLNGHHALLGMATAISRLSLRPSTGTVERIAGITSRRRMIERHSCGSTLR